MIKTKHFMDIPEKDDGPRFWVESCALTKDLCQWCRVDEVLSYLGPPAALAEWFAEHPDGYEHFRGLYHEALKNGPHGKALQSLANAALNDNFTLLHACDSERENTATALYEYLSELSAYREKSG
jgi:uncharacterized protein YeaO (DUF488 family)